MKKMKATKYLIFLCALWSVPAIAQDIEVTDSTSTDWGNNDNGGLNPTIPSGPVTSIAISQSTATLAGNETVRLVATVNVDAANKGVQWSSSNNSVASVSSQGVVLGLSIGTATITATAAGNSSVKATCQVTVTSNYVHGTTGFILPWGRDEAWTMKYQVVEYSMEPGNTAWTQQEYDDSNWSTLSGPIGNERVYNYYWVGENTGFNLRCTFNMSVVDPNAVYTFYAIHDDDLWIYLNGELITHFAGWSEWNERPVQIPASKFKKGVNQLALRIMQGVGGQYLDYGLYSDNGVTGDVNGDGNITAQDASLVLQLVAGKLNANSEGIFYDKADVNDDGSVTAQDASLILQYVAGKISW